MQEKVSRDEAFAWLRLFGEPLKREQWEEGEKIIGRYIGQLEDEVLKAKGQRSLGLEV